MYDDFGGGNAFGPALQLNRHTFGNKCAGPPNGVTFSRDRARQLLTPDLFQPTRVLLDLRVGAIGACEAIDDDDNEAVVLEYSVDGASFVEHRRFPSSALTIVDETLPTFPPNTPVQVRMRQLQNTGTNSDEWSVHNFAVACKSFAFGVMVIILKYWLYYTGFVPTSITIALDTQPDNGVDVEFTHNIVPGGTFSLDDDVDATLANSVSLSASNGDQHRVTLQGLPANHHLEAIECDSDDVIVQLDQRRVLINVNDGIVCTFVVVGKEHDLCLFHVNVLNYISLIFRSRIMLFETRQRWLCEKHL